MQNNDYQETMKRPTDSQIKLNAKKFLVQSFENYEKQNKIEKFYLSRLTENIDKIFIIDLSKIKVKLIEKKRVIKNLHDFLTHFISKSDSTGITIFFIMNRRFN